MSSTDEVKNEITPEKPEEKTDPSANSSSDLQGNSETQNTEDSNLTESKVEEKPIPTDEITKTEPELIKEGNSNDSGSEDDGGESPPIDEEDENEGPDGPDDDEDAKNPAYIPRKGAFYMHDSRNDDADGSKEDSAKKSRADKRWAHDLFDDRQQRPKSKTELIRKYGYDIRGGEKTEQDIEEEKEKPRNNRRNKRNTDKHDSEDREFRSVKEKSKEMPKRDRRPVEQRERQPIRRDISREDDHNNRENRRHQPNTSRGTNSYRRMSKRGGSSGDNHFVNDKGHFKKTYVSSTARGNRRDDMQRNGNKQHDDNHNNVAKKLPKQVSERQQSTSNGSTPPKQPSTPSTPRSKGSYKQQGTRPSAIVPPMPLMGAPPGAYVQPQVVPIVVPVPTPVNYPHPRQPTEIVYFDPNSQTNVTRTPPQPREKKLIPIAPPTN